MSTAFRYLTPREIISLGRILVGASVLFGLGCLETVYHPLARALPLHGFAQAGAASLIAGFFASVAVAAFAVYSDIDAPRSRSRR